MPFPPICSFMGSPSPSLPAQPMLPFAPTVRSGPVPDRTQPRRRIDSNDTIPFPSLPLPSGSAHPVPKKTLQNGACGFSTQYDPLTTSFPMLTKIDVTNTAHVNVSATFFASILV